MYFETSKQILSDSAMITFSPPSPPTLTVGSTLGDVTAVLEQMCPIATPHSLSLEGKGQYRGGGRSRDSPEDATC